MRWSVIFTSYRIITAFVTNDLFISNFNDDVVPSGCMQEGNCNPDTSTAWGCRITIVPMHWATQGICLKWKGVLKNCLIGWKHNSINLSAWPKHQRATKFYRDCWIMMSNKSLDTDGQHSFGSSPLMIWQRCSGDNFSLAIVSSAMRSPTGVVLTF
jgi:hypothetical protein